MTDLKKLNFIHWHKAILFLPVILFCLLMTEINATELKDDTLLR